MPDKGVLRQYQALPLIAKVRMSQARIAEWYRHWEGNVYISFSGGKDSTVLAHLVHEYYPDVPLVFANTGLEYPEIQAFARKMGAEFIRPKMRFDEVISKYGYPIISKENAEAIYVARRIRNGGGYVPEREGRKKHWIDGKREELHGAADRACDARTPEIPVGGGTTHLYGKRADMQGLRMTYEAARRADGDGKTECGLTGDDKPLPG